MPSRQQRTGENLQKFNIYIEAATIERLKTIASKEHRSVSSLINVAIDKYLEAFDNDSSTKPNANKQ